MDAAKKTTYKLSPLWVDRIFTRLTEIYGERFTSKFKNPEAVESAKAQWCNGLYGLSGDEIKKVLNLCLNNYIKEPPNVIEFYHYGKQWKMPLALRAPVTKASPEVVRHHMHLMRQKLYG